MLQLRKRSTDNVLQLRKHSTDIVLQLRKRSTDNVLRFKTPNVPWLFPSVLGGYDHDVPRLICSLGTGFHIVPWSFVPALGGYDQLGVWSMFYAGWGIL